MKSGWRTGERWSTPSGSRRMRATSSETLAPSSTPPVPGLAPCPTTISTASARAMSRASFPQWEGQI